MSSILITCRNKPAVEKHYVPALRLAGWTGKVLVVAPDDPRPNLSRVLGLVMTGGDDIHPRHWDPAEAPDATAALDEARDALEIPIALEAWELGLPILGICRGEQLLNVALGGSLIQDLPSHYNLDPALHRRGTALEPEPAHTVRVDPGSRLAGLLGAQEVAVNSRHHQAVLRVAPALKAVAWHAGPNPADPDLVEAVEARDPARWALGVQWHPENLVNLPGPVGQAARAIFRGFLVAVQDT